MLETTLTTAGLDALIAGSPHATAAAIYETNLEIAATARTLVHVDTGETRSTIQIDVTGDPLEQEVVAGGASLWLELGHHAPNGRMVGPFPFLKPSFDLHWPALPGRIANYLYILASGQALPTPIQLPNIGTLGP